MTGPSSDRILGLSPRARRVVVPLLLVAVLVIVVGTLLTQRSSGGSGDVATTDSGPLVGSDLHAVAGSAGRLFVAGHGGAGYRDPSGGWRQIESLANKDVMGWAAADGRLLAGGHEGLYASTDDGATFDQVAGLPVSDVHGLGGAGEVIYLSAPEGGVFVSADGGETFEERAPQRGDIMGTIWVDPSDSDVAIASSMRDGAVKTTDGGRTWTALGSGTGSMSVAVGEGGVDLFVIGTGDAQVSTDGGTDWASAAIPGGTSAAFHTAEGKLVVAALDGDRADVYEQVGTQWDPLS